jgi:hypothetical protein
VESPAPVGQPRRDGVAVGDRGARAEPRMDGVDQLSLGILLHRDRC